MTWKDQTGPPPRPLRPSTLYACSTIPFFSSQIFPTELWGSRRNMVCLSRGIERFVVLRRHETMSVLEVKLGPQAAAFVANHEIQTISCLVRRDRGPAWQRQPLQCLLRYAMNKKTGVCLSLPSDTIEVSGRANPPCLEIGDPLSMGWDACCCACKDTRAIIFSDLLDGVRGVLRCYFSCDSAQNTICPKGSRFCCCSFLFGRLGTFSRLVQLFHNFFRYTRASRPQTIPKRELLLVDIAGARPVAMCYAPKKKLPV